MVQIHIISLNASLIPIGPVVNAINGFLDVFLLPVLSFLWFFAVMEQPMGIKRFPITDLWLP